MSQSAGFLNCFYCWTMEYLFCAFQPWL
uniref:Uncharacterized protein n=1 Tax=Arundo donax TaxID=35708 RepID=A0A0A8ZUC0_ARUDO